MLLSFFPGAVSSFQPVSNGCFVTQFAASNSRRSHTLSFQRYSHPRQSTLMRGLTTSSDNNNKGDDTNDSIQSPNNPNQLIPILMYTIVPFLPSIAVQTLNDNYQQLKQQFNVAAAALPPGAATDSAEYIAASNMYNESMQSLLILLLSKRVALYFLATMATLYAGWRASVTIRAIERGYLRGPGMALDNLNREVMKGETNVFATVSEVDADVDATADLAIEVEKEDSDDDDDNLFATLVDDSPQSTKVGGAIALTLPLLLSASLALSYTLISFFKDGSGGDSSISSAVIGEEYFSAIQGLLPYLTSIPSMALCVLFLATEFRGVSKSNTAAPQLLCAENIAALLYVAGAYIAKVYPTITIGDGWSLDLGPLQNGVNIAFAATVVRALSPFLISYPSNSESSPKVKSISIQTMALALIGVTVFDGISVFGTVANAATIDNGSSASVMETVATYKADAQLWNPGLLSVVVGHGQNAKPTEALGLGDVVFPACLVAWSFFADAMAKSNDNADDMGEMSKKKISYATATTAGYVIGSAATEIVGTFSLLGSGRGLPALIFLIPSMLATVTAVALSRGELNEVWGGNSETESNVAD